jgi:hypothetical protein
LAVVCGCGATAAWAQNYPVTPQQRATAQQTAQQGVPLSELAPNAPDEYTVKPGDTLWAISRLYLLRPWRWPELWGMNINEIANPHRIYPGQVLYLDKTGGRARLTTRRGGFSGDGGTIKLSPRTRFDSLAGMALPTLNPSMIEPFLSEPIVVDANALDARRASSRATTAVCCCRAATAPMRAAMPTRRWSRPPGRCRTSASSAAPRR